MINRLSYSRLGNISFIALVTISYFVPRSLRSLVTKYDVVSRAIKLISPRLSYDNLYIYNHPGSFPEGGTVGTIYGFARDCYALRTEQLMSISCAVSVCTGTPSIDT